MSARSPRSTVAQVRDSVRTCVGCRQRAAKSDLLRVVAADRGVGLEVVPDPAGRAPGRGAHLHPVPECLDLALRRRAFPRALRVQQAGGLATTAVQDLVNGTSSTQHTRPTRNWSSSS